MPRRADGNQAEIFAAVRAFGADVLDMHTVGGGFPDALVCFRRWLCVAEIKNLAGRGNKLTPRQVRWREQHPDVPVLTFLSPEQAVPALLAAWQARRTREETT